MNLRPRRAAWFELLLTHDDLTDSLAALAHTGSIELERHAHLHLQMDLQDLQTRMQAYAKLQRYYASLWPKSDTALSTFTGSPVEIFDEALSNIYRWEEEVQPEIQRLEITKNHLTDFHLVELLLNCNDGKALDYSLLSINSTVIAARLFLLPSKSRLENIPNTVLWKECNSATHNFLLLVATIEELDALSAELIHKKYTYIQIPPLPARWHDAVIMLKEKQAQLQENMLQLQKVIDALAKKYKLAQSLGEIQKIQWFLQSIPSLAVSDNFVWITGWTSDRSGDSLRKALQSQGSRAILHFPEAPDDLSPPLILHNPWWAKPFEIFAGMLGTPGKNEADPSKLLAILVPLLFGYMFGDVGQGFILLLAGIFLQKRWPLLRILIANGASAMLFGVIFGSMFGREDLIPALWLHPVSQPLPVLAVPLVVGALIILLGLILSALESSWRGEWQRWLRLDAPVIVLYLGIVSLFSALDFAMLFISGALLWFIIGSFIQAKGKILPVLASIGGLFETTMQLALNALSFVRVGAFALAHAGLSMAFSIMADSASSMVIALIIMLLGNIIVIVLEGLVVSIQTTRLVLFEFFIRFLQADGRVFKPLNGPVTETINN